MNGNAYGVREAIFAALADAEAAYEKLAAGARIAANAEPVAGGAPGAGWAITAGGSRLPMEDLIRMGAHAVHYLSTFDGRGRAVWLGRAKRLASADQRIVRDRG